MNNESKEKNCGEVLRDEEAIRVRSKESRKKEMLLRNSNRKLYTGKKQQSLETGKAENASGKGFGKPKQFWEAKTKRAERLKLKGRL